MYKSIRSLFPLSNLAGKEKEEEEQKIIRRKKEEKKIERERRKEVGQVEAQAQIIKTRINCND